MLKLKRADIAPRPEQEVSLAAMAAFGNEFYFSHFDDFVICPGSKIVDDGANRNLQDNVLACFSIAKLRLTVTSCLGVEFFFETKPI